MHSRTNHTHPRWLLVRLTTATPDRVYWDSALHIRHPRPRASYPHLHVFTAFSLATMVMAAMHHCPIQIATIPRHFSGLSVIDVAIPVNAGHATNVLKYVQAATLLSRHSGPIPIHQRERSRTSFRTAMVKRTDVLDLLLFSRLPCAGESHICLP
ncbi:hypothetical protein BD310DRAFT_919088 [Dichomitus squalens]|uniref:Uncharacterized protein n=1 Tax=Dichomitus squalens TaxID=114155 RepID=A0A4Q9Q6Q5_9APHY|nr:hypothetical protein BD310DRAFT_919088 [Dichomitus squalens]